MRHAPKGRPAGRPFGVVPCEWDALVGCPWPATRATFSRPRIRGRRVAPLSAPPRTRGRSAPRGPSATRCLSSRHAPGHARTAGWRRPQRRRRARGGSPCSRAVPKWCGRWRGAVSPSMARGETISLASVPWLNATCWKNNCSRRYLDIKFALPWNCEAMSYNFTDRESIIPATIPARQRQRARLNSAAS